MGLSCKGSPTSSARRERHSAPTAACGGACPASSTSSQPISPGPNERKERANEAKVLLSTGTTMNNEAQAERIASRENPCRCAPVNIALIRNRLERIRAASSSKNVRCSFSA